MKRKKYLLNGVDIYSPGNMMVLAEVSKKNINSEYVNTVILFLKQFFLLIESKYKHESNKIRLSFFYGSCHFGQSAMKALQHYLSFIV